MNLVKLIVAIVLVLIVWGLIRVLLGTVLAIIFKIALIALFVGLVWTVYQAMTNKQKNMI